MISNFLDLKKEHEGISYLPPAIVDNIQQRMNIRELTPLQKKAFNSSEFWGTKNLIVQGTTSSGKTLIAEVAAARCIWYSGQEKNVIYLVPLKAMVSEKYAQFKKDMSNDKYDWNICPSSADYQNFDGDIVDGDFNLAIVVYEKFFAFLAQKENERFLSSCGLVIIDEIQMLAEIDRGAKLEFSIAKLLKDYNNIRIMGLTTIHCGIGKLENWLNAVDISTPERSCDLQEYIVMTNGEFKAKYRSKNDEGDSKEVFGTIEKYVGKDKRKSKHDERKTDIMLALIKQELEHGTEDNPIKFIVFAHSKRATEELAFAISSSGILPERRMSSELKASLGWQDDDVVISKMSGLIKHGVAYHNASLPQGTRELIEEQFENGIIQVVVATETLAIGLNLPADVIILYDHTVKKEGMLRDIEAHAYKNYIGRAGRLGLTNRAGKSFLITDNPGETNGCWDRYINATPKDIESVFSSLSAEDLAPYYLNYIAGKSQGVINIPDLENFYEHTFGYGLKSRTEPQNLMNDILNALKTAKLVEIDKEALQAEFDFEIDENDGLIPLKTSAFGNLLAPFALPLRTCKSIIIYFLFNDRHRQYIGGLPDDYSSDDLNSDKYLLDIFYRICCMTEIQKMNFLRMPSTEKAKYSTLITSVNKYLEKASCELGFWKLSPLESFLISQKDNHEETAALRAIILFHWLKGELPNEISKNSGIDMRLTIGDLDHLSEMCGYLIEVISKCIPRRIATTGDNNNRLMSEFHKLSNRVKYGLPLELVRIKNRHVSGITRRNLIEMSRDKDVQNYDTPIRFIQQAPRNLWSKYFTRSQREELLIALEDPMIRGSASGLAGKLYSDLLISDTQKNLFDQRINTTDWTDWEKLSKRLLQSIGMKLDDTDTEGQYIYKTKSGKKIEFIFPKVKNGEILSEDSYDLFKNDISNININKVIIIARHGFSSGILTDNISPSNSEKVLCLSDEVFIGFICQSISCGDGNGLDVFSNAIWDLFGEIEQVNNRLLMSIMKNYVESEEPNQDDNSIIYALFDNSSSEELINIQENCSRMNMFCKPIKWGEDTLDYLSEMIQSKKPIFVYFDEESTAKSTFMRYQIHAIINSTLRENLENRLLVMWKDDKTKKVFESEYPDFHYKGIVRNDMAVNDVIKLIKERLGIDDGHEV